MLALAWRNIWRQRRRGMLTAAVVAMVMSLTLLLFGCSEAMKNGMFENLTDNTGHLVVRVAGWRKLRRFDELLIPNAGETLRRIHGASASLQVASLLEVPVLLAGEVRSRGIQLLGLDQPPALRERFESDYLSEGRLPAVGNLEEIVLGKALAQALRVGVGDAVYAYAPGTEGVGAAAYTVVGLLDLPESTFEARAAYLPLAAAQELAAPEAVTRFEIHLPDLKRLEDEGAVPALQEVLKGELGPGLSVETWRQANPDLATILDLLGPILLFYAAIFFGIAGLLVINTVYLSVVERIGEFGVIIALGANRWKIMRLVLLETLFLVLSGALIGGSLGLAAVLRMSRGFSLPLGLAKIYAEFGLPTRLYAGVSLEQILLTLLFAAATALLAALWPAWVAGRLRPVEAMRFVA